MATFESALFVHPGDTLIADVKNIPTKDNQPNWFLKLNVKNSDGITLANNFTLYFDSKQQVVDLVMQIAGVVGLEVVNLEEKERKAEIAKYTESIGGYSEGDLLTKAEYLEMVHQRGLIESDGHGYPVREMREEKEPGMFFVWPIRIVPSTDMEFPETATHIVWYNK